MESQKEKLWERLEKWQKHKDSKMDKDRYLSMMDELGQEPKEEEIPPGLEDLPPIVGLAIDTFNSLGDRIYPDIGYIGKDYTNLSKYIKINHVYLILYISCTFSRTPDGIAFPLEIISCLCPVC